jgi:hypothetical protein
MALYYRSREEWIESDPLLIRIGRLRRCLETVIPGLSEILETVRTMEAEIRGRYESDEWFPKREPYIAATRSRTASVSRKRRCKGQDTDPS